MTRDVTLALIGLGNVGRAFLDLLVRKEAVLAQRYGLRLSVVAAADSSGGVWDPVGLDPAALLAHKRSGRGAGAFPVVRGATVLPGGGGATVLPGGGVRLDPVELVRMAQADCVVEASPVNLRTGQPGLDCARAALGGGADLVLANKGPLVHAFAELEALAAANGRGLAYSATVCGALPVVNVGRRDLAACDIRRVRGIFNSTSNSILAAMARGESYDSALRAAQEAGIAEADPSLDVEGWDTASKLVIIANSVLRQPATLADVQPVEGIGGITPALMAAGQARSETVKLVATAERDPGGRYRLSVRPEWLPGDDFLAGVRGWEMGIVWDTDIMGLQQHKVDERGPIPTAAAVLRDVITLCGKAQ